MDQVLLSIETPNAPPMTYMVPSGGEISIGRDETCTVVLASPDISRRHVSVMIQSSAIVVRDSSSNGTQVGSQRVFRSEIPVPFGTPIMVGPYVIRVVRQAPANAGPGPASTVAPGQGPSLPPLPGRGGAQTLAAPMGVNGQGSHDRARTVMPGQVPQQAAAPPAPPAAPA
ncbi:MAG: FHA domain-containing protein, partial [Deltaproteobacteria bacterium]|nr:FHA domain-containing protein [Deltaproteobacteria bacterium]